MIENQLPLISIVVPMHNAEKYIQRCVESIRNQEYKNYELILVDDHSTDDTLHICESKYVDDRIIVISNDKKKGVSSARNFGIDRAKGEYITFIDADDVVCPIYLNTLYEIDCQYSECLPMCRLTEFSDNEPVYVGTEDSNVIKIATKLFLSNIYFYHPSACACLFRSDLIKKYNIRFEENCSFCEDDYFTSKYMTFCKGAALIDSSLYGYYVNYNGIGAHKEHDKLTIKDVNHRAESILGLNDALEFTNTYNSAVSDYIRSGYTFIAADVILTAKRAKTKDYNYKNDIKKCFSLKYCWMFVKLAKNKKQAFLVIGMLINPYVVKSLLDFLEKKRRRQ